MSVRVTGNLPWSPGGIIEHCSPSVGRGPVEEIPRVRFPPFSKSPSGETSFPCFVFFEPWSPAISCFSSFSRSIACKMCLRYLNDHYSTQVPKYPFFILSTHVKAALSSQKYSPPPPSFSLSLNNTEDWPESPLVWRLSRLGREVVKNKKNQDFSRRNKHTASKTNKDPHALR